MTTSCRHGRGHSRRRLRVATVVAATLSALACPSARAAAVPPVVPPGVQTAVPVVPVVPGAGPAPGATSVSVTEYGAVPGDGLDDLVAFQAAAVAARAAGLPVTAPKGTFDLSGMLTLDSVVLIGAGSGTGGTVLISHDPLQAALRLTGQGAGLTRLTHEVPGLGIRTSVPTASNVLVLGASGFTVAGTAIRGGDATGIATVASDHGVIRDNAVADTLADGIHTTGASSEVTISGNHVTDTGDDEISVVSYQRDPGPTHDITESHNVVSGGHTRGLSVVGGEHVTLSHNRVVGTAAAGVYIAAEVEFHTRDVLDVRAVGNVVTGSPTQTRSGHPAVLVYASTGRIEDVRLKRNTVIGGVSYAFGSHLGSGLVGVANPTGANGAIGDLYLVRNVVEDLPHPSVRLLAGTLHLRRNKGF